VSDLKPENIMLGFEDPTMLQRSIEKASKSPAAYKAGADRTVFQSVDDFGPLQSQDLSLQIGDFGHAERGDVGNPQIHPIQPDQYRAPEVILGAGWTYSADIWNVGVLVSLFCKILY